MSIYTDKYAFIIDIEKYIIRCVEKSAFISHQVVEGSRYESWIYVIGKKNKAENYQKIIQIIHELKLNNYFNVFYSILMSIISNMIFPLKIRIIWNMTQP